MQIFFVLFHTICFSKSLVDTNDSNKHSVQLTREGNIWHPIAGNSSSTTTNLHAGGSGGIDGIIATQEIGRLYRFRIISLRPQIAHPRRLVLVVALGSLIVRSLVEHGFEICIIKLTTLLSVFLAQNTIGHGSSRRRDRFTHRWGGISKS